MNIIGLFPAQVAELWPALKWAFDSFSERSHTPAHVLLRDLLDKDRQCWIAVVDDKIRAVALTQIKEDSVCLTHCAGQGREDWQEQIVKEISAWGQHEGAKRFVAVCRPGWSKMLKEQGFRETHRVMELEYGRV